jgi:hypothetical protein
MLATAFPLPVPAPRQPGTARAPSAANSARSICRGARPELYVEGCSRASRGRGDGHARRDDVATVADRQRGGAAAPVTGRIGKRRGAGRASERSSRHFTSVRSLVYWTPLVDGGVDTDRRLCARRGDDRRYRSGRFQPVSSARVDSNHRPITSACIVIARDGLQHDDGLIIHRLIASPKAVQG